MCSCWMKTEKLPSSSNSQKPGTLVIQLAGEWMFVSQVLVIICDNRSWLHLQIPSPSPKVWPKWPLTPLQNLFTSTLPARSAGSAAAAQGFHQVLVLEGEMVSKPMGLGPPKLGSSPIKMGSLLYIKSNLYNTHISLIYIALWYVSCLRTILYICWIHGGCSC